MLYCGEPYLLVSKGVHIANNLSGHLASVSGTILEGSLDDGHDQSEGRGINEMYKFGVQKGLKTCLGPSGWISQSIQQNGRYS